MKIVRENIEFERGKDPKDAMGLGLKRKLWNHMYHAFKEFDLNDSIDNFKVVGSMEIDDHTVHILKNLTDFRAKSPFFYAIEFPDGEIDMNELYFTYDVDATAHARNRITPLAAYESLDFERGKDPRISMGIGTFKDKEGNSLEVGDEVFVYGNDDLPDFQANIESFHDEYAFVIQKDGFGFEVDYDKLKLIESVNFERGRDPKEGIGVGMKTKLKERSLKNLVGHSSNSKRIAAEIGGEFMYDIDPEKIYLLTKSGDVESNRKHPLFDKKMWKVLEPHLSEYNIKRTRSTGAGVDTTIYETPYGKVVREHNRLGVDLYWAEFDTYMELLNSLKDIDVNEGLEFERGRNPKKVMRIGGRELLKDDILGNQSGWSNPEISRAEGTLQLPADDIFILGFAGEYDFNKWKFNDFTEKLENLCKEGEVLDRHRFGDNIYLLLQTDVGKIARAVLDEEGIYYYGGIEAALNLDLPNVPQSKRESLPYRI